MIDTIKKEYKVLLVIFFAFLVNLFFFWLKQGSLTIDTGREFYIPWQMLKGQVLYKDIFNIYGPLSYQINSLSFLLFGQKITSLYFLGIINSFVILTSLYFISREFLDKLFSSLIVFFVMYSSVFTVGLFNFNFPYSFAMSYSFSAFLLAVYFLIKYVKEPKFLYSYISCFFLGVAVANKYEYFSFLLLVAYVLFFLKPLPKKEILKSFGMFLMVPTTSFLILFFQGLRINDLIYAFSIIKNMSQCQTLKYIYTFISGTYFNPKLFHNVVKHFLDLAGLFFILFSFESITKNIQKKSLKIIIGSIFVLLSVMALILLKVLVFGFFPILNLLLLVCFFKIVYKSPAELVLMLSAFIASLKTFFALNIFVYGSYVIPLLLVSIVVFFVSGFQRFCKIEFINNAVKNSIIILLSAFILYLASVQIAALGQKPSLLKTPKGNIYGEVNIVKTYDELIAFINAKTKKTDKIVMLPETPFINFFTDRDSDNYYNSLIPLYIETFGEDNIIRHFKATKPEYIVINNRDTSDYGYAYMCKDYAVNFCTFVKENYDSVKIIENRYNAVVYRRKDLK